MYGPVAEIHLGRLAANYHNIQQLVGNAKVLAVVKANGYGHGMIPVARRLAVEGVHGFGVAILQEALELRSAGIRNMILHMGRFDPDHIGLYVQQDIRLTIQDLADIEHLAKFNAATGHEVVAHLKVDTGMGRLGVPYEQALEALEGIAAQSAIRLEGIFGHFATAGEEDQSFMRYQLVRFTQLVHNTRKLNLNVEYFHTANSSAIVNDPESHFNMVRPGLLLYGALPSLDVKPPFEPQPVMDLKAPLVLKKEIRRGMPVGYGRVFRAPQDTRVGTLQIGYADGLQVALAGKYAVELAGKAFNLIGRVSMDTCNIDLGTADPECGEMALIWGLGSDRQLRVEQLAELARTISYELLVNTGTRVERVYVED
ncbi:MAG: alanine racemase [Candidatus Marinimicrobia bacterium]|nr:alanine racemase [Candidatus Neomarinimicrobiota bacterium]